MFEVSAREGERLSEWSARAESVFHAKTCERDAGIAFTDMVKGYLCLHRCGLSDDQRAVMLGHIGKYEIASIAPDFRSCFLEYQVPKFSRRISWSVCQKCRRKWKSRRSTQKKSAVMVWTMWSNS